MASHSLLFIYDTYTQTGVMLTFKWNDQWMTQIGINAGDDMAPWYQSAVPCGYAAVRCGSKDNNDATYTVINQANNAKFSHFTHTWGEPGNVPSGHDNFNSVVTT